MTAGTYIYSFVYISATLAAPVDKMQLLTPLPAAADIHILIAVMLLPIPWLRHRQSLLTPTTTVMLFGATAKCLRLRLADKAAMSATR